MTDCRSCPVWHKSIFRSLRASELEQLSQVKELKQFERHQVITKKGMPIDHLFCLFSGSAKVVMEGADLHNIVRIISKGEMAGYRCIFSEERFRGSAIALQETTACRIPTSFIYRLIEENSLFARELLKNLGEELAMAETRYSRLCQQNVRERVAEALLLLDQKCGEGDGPFRSLNIFLSRGELANWIGMAKETLIRALSDFKKEGLIEIKEDQLILLKREEIREMLRTSNFGRKDN